MIAATATAIKSKAGSYALAAALVAVLTVVATLPALHDYIPWRSSNFIIGCLTLPLLLKQQSMGTTSVRFSFIALIFCSIYCLLPVKTCLYVTLISALLGQWESRFGKTSALPLFTLLLMSPVASSFADTFSFPIRLQLTQVAGAVLNAIGTKSTVAGNMISCGGVDFSVDPACMGLHMLITSLLCTMLLIALRQKRTCKIIALKWIIALLLLAFGLNILANVLRIVLLVFFHLLPANPMHEVTGILCLLVYVLLPVYGAVTLISKYAPAVKMTPVSRSRWPVRGLILQIAVLALLSTTAWAMRNKAGAMKGALPQLPGYTASWYDADIAQLKSPHVLIYMKRLRGFYFTEHNPMMCWVGSGYEFGKVERIETAGLRCCTGILQKGDARLYTAWWYDDGSYRSNDMSWRVKALGSKNDFSIVNITADKPETLQAELLKVASSTALRRWIMANGSR